MRQYKPCIRCNASFLATYHQLVCDMCYGTPEDLDCADVINTYGMAVSRDELKRIRDMVIANTKHMGVRS